MKHIISFLLRTVPRKYLQLFSHSFLKIVALFYAGSDVQCPVCEKKFRKFLPYGRNSRQNALCPHCLSLERHRLLWLYLNQKTDFFTSPNKVLHIAPELCYLERFKKMKNLTYTTGDLESPLADIKMDIHDMPLESDSYDVVFCNHVMEHVDNDIKAMEEIRRVLKPGGWAIIQVPFFHPIPNKTLEDSSITGRHERERIFGQDDHVRKYGYDYPQRLESAGFTVTQDQFVKELSEEVIRTYALPPEEIIFIAKKI